MSSFSAASENAGTIDGPFEYITSHEASENLRHALCIWAIAIFSASNVAYHALRFYLVVKTIFVKLFISAMGTKHRQRVKRRNLLSKKHPPSISSPLPNVLFLLFSACALRWILSAHSGFPLSLKRRMDLTLNTPIPYWYGQDSGLDLPPLAGYHSYLLAQVSANVTPNIFTRNQNTVEDEIFVRAATLLTDAFVMFPAVISLLEPRFSALALCLPAVLLTDYVLYGFSCVSLGLSFLTFRAAKSKKVVQMAFWYSMAINFKGSVIYFALPIVTYALSLCLGEGIFPGLSAILVMGLAFGVIWVPWLCGNLDAVGCILHRLANVDETFVGVKLANVWSLMTPEVQNEETLCYTALFLVLSVCFHVALHPDYDTLKLAVVNTLLAWLLFACHPSTWLLVLAMSAALFDEFPGFGVFLVLTATSNMFVAFIDYFWAYFGLVMVYVGSAHIVTPGMNWIMWIAFLFGQSLNLCRLFDPVFEEMCPLYNFICLVAAFLFLYNSQLRSKQNKNQDFEAVLIQ
ncbi:unnamed protein product [Notodromas monacha]|uniref:Alpha-1,3-glucosyltransferase n=1 Tax=Notodromas monacha TaxID=399045 RepID=A0A7R9BDH4_9CRUS|nr:unnamed protein product [Notodromas monacha]CAG0913375.1 unnamed protein product [Notodromas monacha]